ncbi:MAG: hypothetical protein H6Q77_2247 [Gemmatimonadetes bacterium]|nr:hypothetical protein [Gemmatimonadota bacterium]
MSPVALPMRFRLLATAAGILAVAACGPTISSDRDPTIPIPAGATAEFEGGTVEGPQQVDPATRNDIVHRRIQLAIVQQLQEKGYKVVDSTQEATFRVRYFVGIKKSTEYVTTTTGVAYSPWGYGYGYGWGYGGYGYGGGITTTQPVTTTDVSFVVDLVDEKTGNTAWRGIWQGTPGAKAPSQDQVNTTMAKIFSTAPKVP